MKIHHILLIVLLFLLCACPASAKESVAVLLGGSNIRVAEGDMEFSTPAGIVINGIKAGTPPGISLILLF